DLLTLMKSDVESPGLLIDIKRIAELDDLIELTSDGLRLGALATISEIQHDPLVRSLHPALAEAAGVAATPQLRNMAMIGGNLLQRPRCWYFRDSEISCWLKGGDTCPAAEAEGENQFHAILGESPCHAVHPSDLATVLVALDARIVVRGKREERTLPIEEFFSLPTEHRRIEHTLAKDELIVAIVIPDVPSATRSTYLKAMDRKVWAFALVGAAVQVTIADGIITRARVVLGGVAPIPWRVPAAESALIGSAADPDLLERAAAIAVAGARPLSKNAYKVQLAKTLMERALATAMAV
ncbi:MAG TPA: FAD binding domain-containing protein, partial [Thermomicrobiales bacterium]|nr:FAD binding domain-containing protein [Thermomicrobiales bacterium]